MPSPALVLSLLLVGCFAFATRLEVWRQSWTPKVPQSPSLIEAFLGDSRRLFANHFFVKADVYFHSGYYPTMFDSRMSHESSHLTEEINTHEPSPHETPEAHGHEEDHDEAGDFLGRPKDWIDAFGRNFFPSRHSHLDEAGDEREILPWLRISAELDPQRVETYVIAAFWLRNRLGKVNEAEAFLREGWTANRDSYEILFELGRLYNENRKDADRARNVWELALQKWKSQESTKPQPDILSYQQIAGQLARLEEQAGNYAKAVSYLEMLQAFSPNRAEIQKQIEELKRK
jgi:tetratricopeptide (TPR) repeat protein